MIGELCGAATAKKHEELMSQMLVLDEARAVN